MAPTRYGLWLRLTDAYHGWRDGRAEIPSKPPMPVPITTGHREALIRLAQDAFTSEELEYRTLVAEPHRQIMAERARLSAAQARLAWVRSVFDRTPATLTAAQAKRRRLGEEHHPETIIVQRRQREHLKLRAREQMAVERIQAEIGVIEADLADAEERARQQHKVVVARVERIQEHIQHRLEVYRRALVRSHPDGAWANAVLSVPAPEIPGWALPDAFLPESPRRRQRPPEPKPHKKHEEERPVTIIALRHAVTKFGSAQAPEGDDKVGYVTLAAPIAADWHFTIAKTADGLLELKTRGFGRGPYLGGEIPGAVVLNPGDSFEFADRRYTMLDAHRLEDASLGKNDLIVADLSATSGSKSRLSHMSFVQRESTLLAVIGPSGAGKSSLISALLGELPLGSGRLFFRDMSIATHARQIRESAGFVPQGTELHKSLTVEATLRYGAKLRSGAAKAARSQAVDDAIRETELEDVRHQPLSTLSGGQYRRVSIALELLTGPPLLMLDEPTSGLDANLDRQIMRLLSRLAGEGRTVIVVTHATEHLYLADQVLAVIKGGTPAYAGSPRPMQRRFGFETYADFLDTLNANHKELAEQYQSSHMADEACREADDLELRIANGSVASGRRAARGRSTTLRLLPRRFWVLTVRQCVLLLTRAQSEKVPEHWRRLKNGFLLCLPLIVAALSAMLAALVAGSPGLGAVPSPVGETALALLTTLCVLSGQALTYSDVVSELPVIGREFRAGIGAFPVLAAKWLVYAVLAVAQAAVITLVFCGFPDRAPQRSIWLGPQVDLFIGLAALSIAAMSLGMFVSTLASKLEHAVALITVTSIAQIALNGVTSDLSQRSVTSLVAALLPDRWGLAAAASSVDLRGINQGHPTQVVPDALWSHTQGQWFMDLCALGLLCVIFFSLAAWRLHAKFKLPKAVHKHPRR